MHLGNGDLISSVRHAEGFVMVNSTMRLVALEQGMPTLTLCGSVCNVPGLTVQLALDDCWMSCIQPDARLFGLFRWVVIQVTQITGRFYCRQGIDLVVENSSRILTVQHSPLEALL